MIRHLKTVCWSAVLLLGASMVWPASADDKANIEARELVSEARFTVERLVADAAIGPE